MTSMTLVLTTIFVSAFCDIRLDGNGYVNLVVELPGSVQIEDREEILGKLTRLFQESSQRLHTAIGVYFKTVQFLLPRDWTSETLEETSRNVEQFRRPDFQLDLTNSSDWTQQSGPCGHSGDIIFLNHALLSLNIQEAAQQLVSQWMRFRYGVFLEFPQDDDSICYFESGRWRFTGCFDKSSEGFETRNECLKDRGSSILKEQPSSSILSSLLCTEIKHVCGEEDYPHNSAAPTKHNLYCSDQTVQEVIRKSADFKNTGSTTAGQLLDNTTFQMIKVPPRPRYVLLIQGESPQKDFSGIYVLYTDVLNFLVKYILPDEAMVSVVIVTDKIEVTDFGDENDLMTEQKREAIMQATNGHGGPNSEALLFKEGILKAIKLLDSESGTVILIGMMDDLPIEELDEVTQGLNAIRFSALVLTTAASQDMNKFSELKKVIEGSSGNLVSVHWEKQLDNFWQITEGLISLYNTPSGIHDGITTVF